MATAAITLMTMTTVFTACSIDKVDNPVNPTVDPEEKLADATILWYGCGGGNVDAGILDDFRTISTNSTRLNPKVLTV